MKMAVDGNVAEPHGLCRLACWRLRRGRSFPPKVSNFVQMAPFQRWYSSVVWPTLTGSKAAYQRGRATL